MGSKELLEIDPSELKFPFELKKQISCSLQLSNKTDDCIAFKVKTTSPKKYCVRPNTEIVQPRSTCDVTVTMQAQKESPPDMQCKDKFLVQSIIVSESIALKDITAEMFSKESGNVVNEMKLKVLYVPPPQPPSPVPESSEEGSSPRPSVPENGHSNSSELIANSSLLSKLSEEKNAAIQLNNKLRQDLELVKREISKQQSGFSLTFVVIFTLLGILLGYIMKT